jgi:hypothetical protein
MTIVQGFTATHREDALYITSPPLVASCRPVAWIADARVCWRPRKSVASPRLRKMVGKNIGVLYFGLPLSNDPRSLLYANIGGPQELDVMSGIFDELARR